jgi:ABC-2 type transport system permease protein
MTAFARETWYLGLRALRRFWRVPANPISTVIFPVIQLVGFSQLFRDIIRLPGFAGQTSYLAYLAPGQIAFTVFLAVSWSGSSLLYDYRNGYLDKLRAAPIHRYSIFAGELFPLGLECAAMAGAILLISILLGATVATGIVGAALILVLCAAFGMAWSGTSFLPALLTRNEQATGTLSLLFFPLAFMSTAFVPARLMPDWLQALNAVNPISYVIEAMRALMTTGFEWGVIGAAVAAIVVVGVVLQGATLWAFGRLTA